MKTAVLIIDAQVDFCESGKRKISDGLGGFKEIDIPQGSLYVPGAEKNIRKVRKELAILIKSKEDKGEKNAVNNARKEINLKYGNDWRSRGLTVNSSNQWKPLSEYK